MISSILVALELLYGASSGGGGPPPVTGGGRSRRRTIWVGVDSWDLSWDRFLEELEDAPTLAAKEAVVTAKHQEVMGGAPVDDTLAALSALLALIPNLQPAWVPVAEAVAVPEAHLGPFRRLTEALKTDTQAVLEERLEVLLKLKEEADEAKKERTAALTALKILVAKLEQLKD
jgi:hypothetical protein